MTDPASQHLGILLKKIIINMYKDLCTGIITEALFAIAKS